MEDEAVIKENERYCDGDWMIDVGIDGYMCITFFYNNHYFSEIMLNVKDGVKVVRHD